MQGKAASPEKGIKYTRSKFAANSDRFKKLLLRWINRASLLLGIRECRLCLSELTIDETFFCNQCFSALNEPGQFIETLPDSYNSPPSSTADDSTNEVLCLTRYTYQERPRLAVQALKYGRREELAEPLAERMLDIFDLALTAAEKDAPYIVTAVPLHRKKIKERGFNQSELLARKLASARKLNYKNILIRQRETKAQYGLTKLERVANLTNAFSTTESLKNHTVILVDDVITSGATAMSCTRALLDAGAKRVIVLALCRARLRQSETSEQPGREQPRFAATHHP